MTSLSYQLYSARNFELESILPELASIGFKEVEGFGGLYQNPEVMRANLDQHGLRMSTGHVDFAVLKNDPQSMISMANIFGMDALIVPFLSPEDRPADFAGWEAFGATLAEAAKPVLDAGLKFGWHNHDFEFTTADNGRMPIEAIMEASDDIGLELDLAWVHVAGQDPAAWLEKYSGRLLAAHVKDCAPQGECEDEDGWADVGHGVMDWQKIVPAMHAAGIELMVLEHDNPSDAIRFAERSFATASSF
jgi:sugar phosphate isomerase/epimerase